MSTEFGKTLDRAIDDILFERIKRGAGIRTCYECRRVATVFAQVPDDKGRMACRAYCDQHSGLPA